ncbi:MAG: type II toxin-antitoxin system VapC family toxin [Pseudomonadota bacterium]
MLIDTNILLDITTDDPIYGEWSIEMLRRHSQSKHLAVNQVVVAELAGEFDDYSELAEFLDLLEIERSEIGFEAAYAAGLVHLEYRKRGGSRLRTLPDFLIGAHAYNLGLPILTRDPSGFQSYFPTVPLITPESHPL